MMETNGTVSTIAGGGSKRPGDKIPATDALLGNIWAVSVDPGRNLYLTSSLGYVHKVTPRTTPPSTLPVISAVVNGASFLAGAAPNTWVTIRGTNLSSQTDVWDKAIIPPGILPTALLHTLDNGARHLQLDLRIVRHSRAPLHLGPTRNGSTSRRVVVGTGWCGGRQFQVICLTRTPTRLDRKSAWS